jgi:hypothetical protein
VVIVKSTLEVAVVGGRLDLQSAFLDSLLFLLSPGDFLFLIRLDFSRFDIFLQRIVNI